MTAASGHSDFASQNPSLSGRPSAVCRCRGRTPVPSSSPGCVRAVCGPGCCRCCATSTPRPTRTRSRGCAHGAGSPDGCSATAVSPPHAVRRRGQVAPGRCRAAVTSSLGGATAVPAPSASPPHCGDRQVGVQLALWQTAGADCGPAQAGLAGQAGRGRAGGQVAGDVTLHSRTGAQIVLDIARFTAPPCACGTGAARPLHRPHGGHRLRPGAAGRRTCRAGHSHSRHRRVTGRCPAHPRGGRHGAAALHLRPAARRRPVASRAADRREHRHRRRPGRTPCGGSSSCSARMAPSCSSRPSPRTSTSCTGFAWARRARNSAGPGSAPRHSPHGRKASATASSAAGAGTAAASPCSPCEIRWARS